MSVFTPLAYRILLAFFGIAIGLYPIAYLRLWLPLFTAGFRLPFEQAYLAVAWFCWVPNLIVGEYLVWRERS